jgi:hypothetical protein
MKKLLIVISLLAIFVLVSAFSFKRESADIKYCVQPTAAYTVSLVDDDADFIPGYGKTYLGFKEAVGFKESQGRYHIVNSLGYLGKYQFGETTLNTLRIHNIEYFLYSSKIQEKAFRANCSYNKWLLQDEIANYVGTTVKGIEITESGILAAAHLSGAGSVKKFLRHKGKNKRIVDAYGTTIESYLSKFSGYDVSVITPSKRPKL